MEKFKRMNYMLMPDGSEPTVAEHKEKFYPDAKDLKVYKNKTYMVLKITHAGAPGKPDLVWLSIKRNDKETIHDWREFQEIKNELVGRECEGIELYPAESRVMDTANQYHLWVIDDPKFRWPFGYKTRCVEGEDKAREVGAKQRPFKKGAVSLWKEFVRIAKAVVLCCRNQK